MAYILRYMILKPEKTPYYLIAGMLVVLFKLAYVFSDTNDLMFMIYPVDKIVSFVSGSRSLFIPGTGFYHENLNITIEGSCSGCNLCIILFVLLTYSGLKYFDKTAHKIILIPLSLILSYCLTLCINASRILTSVLVRHARIEIPGFSDKLIHEMIGITTNLFFLIAIYFLIEKIFQKHFKPCETC